MANVWLRLELFELGLLQLPLKYASTITLENVKKTIDLIQTEIQSKNEVDNDTDMNSTSPLKDASNLICISFSLWKKAACKVFNWREQDYKAFWLLLVYFHRNIPNKATTEASDTSNVVLDQQFCLEEEQIPMYKVIIFMFIQIIRPHSLKTKHSPESFNAVWHKGNDREALGEATQAATLSPLKGSSSPPLPSSPHTVGMQDRSASDAYYLSCIRERLEQLFAFLFPSVAAITIPGADSTAMDASISASQIDLLGFAFAGGDSPTHEYHELSLVFPQWQQQHLHRQPLENASATQVCQFLKKHVALNEELYPPVGFSLAAAARDSTSSNDDTIMTTAGPTNLQRPIILSSLAKNTVIKRPEEFPDLEGKADLVIFGCHDCYIYVMGPVRHVMVTACTNCQIVTAPNKGVYFLDRCEGVRITGISGIFRVRNCLDSVLNVYTLVPFIMSGENVGVQLGPFNSKYPGLANQLKTVQFCFHPHATGAWNCFLNLENDDENMNEKDEEKQKKKTIDLQLPSQFHEVCVPFKMQQATTTTITTTATMDERPFQLPRDYLDAMTKQVETVESLRRLVTSDEFDLPTKRTMEHVIQAHFKEWLSSTGNVRQILDLVQIEKTRSSSTSNRSSSDSVCSTSSPGSSSRKESSNTNDGSHGSVHQFDNSRGRDASSASSSPTRKSARI